MSKVVIGLSGGVDSAVSAYLLKQAGYEVIGVHLLLLPAYCGQTAAPEDARAVAEQLGIEFHLLDRRAAFAEKVVEPFCAEYFHGRTPSPCLVCNREIKFGLMADFAAEIGAEYIATGHYARISQLPNGRYTIRNSVTAAKDQTYALYNLTQFQLSKTLMPIGDYTKDEVRKIAEDRGLAVAKKKDSMEICFVPDNDYAGFIEREAESVPGSGNFVDKNGVILGKHKGITHYTVGQRKGLNLAMGHPVFVTGIRPETNEVVIGEGNDVFSDHLVCRDVNWMAIDGLHGGEREVLAKIRYSHKGSPCIIRELPDGTVECRFKEPQRAITPGQAVVFYENECVVGGGTIL